MKGIGGMQQLKGNMFLHVRYGQKRFEHSFHVGELPTKQQVLLGRDSLHKMKIDTTDLIEDMQENTDKHDDEQYSQDAECCIPEEAEALCDIPSARERMLQHNSSIPETMFCTHPLSIISLDTGNNTPVYRPQYRVPHALKDKVDKQVSQWLATGVTSHAPNDYAWNSPLLVVTKTDHGCQRTGWRVWIDPRPIT